jgi:hypothetical protein
MMTDNISELTSTQAQQLYDAHAPVGSKDLVAGELRQLEKRLSATQQALDVARRNHDGDISVRKSMPPETRERIQRSADNQLMNAESEVRRELVIISRRASSIAKQLQEAALEPTLATVEAEVLQRATSYAPLLSSQLSDAALSVILKRVSAARLRGDKAEALALISIIQPLVRARKDSLPDGESLSDIWAIEEALADLGHAFSDHSFDALIDEALAVTKSATNTDASIILARQQRDQRET